MVAKITVPASVKRALAYNEQKVIKGNAKCLLASGFLKDAKGLTFSEKLARFEERIALNKRASTNSVHISLNFTESERLSEEKQKEIATLYMEKIGFGSQPFLVYEHTDAGHPHLHIVTTNIQSDGRRISLHNLGRGASESARKSLEEQFGLVKASAQKGEINSKIAEPPTQKASYGKVATKRAIAGVLDAVLPHYKYASLAELNAILRRYNILADPGAEGGKLRRNHGLLYHILDERGNKVGMPVKASAIYTKPTLSFLESKFKENAARKERYKKGLQSTIEWVLVRPPKNLLDFEKALQKESISLIIRRNEAGYVYGLGYIDHRSKCFFNGSDLGKGYSASGILKRCGMEQTTKPEAEEKKVPVNTLSKRSSTRCKTKWDKDAALLILDHLLHPERSGDAIPFALRKQKKKRKKKINFSTMHTGENEQGLRKIIDLTRWIALTILLLHFYYECYVVFHSWGVQSDFSDNLLHNIARTGLFHPFYKSKLLALLFLLISLLGARAKKKEKAGYRKPVAFLVAGFLLYFFSSIFLLLRGKIILLAIIYMSVTATGLLLVLTGGAMLSSIIRQKLSGSVFNSENETFPQEERLLQNEYSINLAAQYTLNGKLRKSWINIINPFRGLLVMGTPGSGKSYFIIQHIIKQHIQKGFALFVYDFKFADLTTIAYNHFLLHEKRYATPPSFYSINFDDLSRSHRCNPLAPETLLDITDAAESSRTIMLGLNREWIRKGGDFFVESPINFVTALIWFLRRYKEGKHCTLPHVIELAQVGYDKLFSILRAEPEIEVLINPFVSAYLNDAMEQLEGQIASAKISLSRLSSPSLYWVLSGADFTLDINNPKEPKIVCMGSNPQKTATYGAVLSLYTTALTRMVNRKGGLKTSLLFDEFPTLYFNGIDSLIATARSNKVATTLAVQDASQLKLHYGKEQADVITNIVGNIIAGQVGGESAKHLSERFGKILQDRQSLSINRNDTSITKSKQLEMAIPASKIAALSSGEFVGMVADNPEEKIALKMFCAELLNNHRELDKESKQYAELPIIKPVTSNAITTNYLGIKKDVTILVETEIERMLDTPELSEKIIRKE